MSIPKQGGDWILPLLLLAILLATFLLAAASVFAQTFTVLYSFKGPPDGVGPWGGLRLDGSGTLYGTTEQGGASYHGTVFKLSPRGKETVLYSFLAGYGSEPESTLVRDVKGTLYGTTYRGGAHNLGAVFKLDRKGNETVLHSFDWSDGAYPNAVIGDARGILYGSTSMGGASSGCGTVFRMDAAGRETVLYNFAGGADGCSPYGALFRDSSGNLYGTTYEGGDSSCQRGGCGTVFKVDTAGTETVLYAFTYQGGDGAYPYAGVVRDKAGIFYGTTFGGGEPNCGGGYGCGTVFKLDTSGKETVLYQFTSTGGDGSGPVASVTLDNAGNIYGTTLGGGDPNCGEFGCGIVFKLDTAGKETVLHTFTSSNDGAYPRAGLIRDAAGNLYGVAESGGRPKCGDCGTVFRLTP